MQVYRPLADQTVTVTREEPNHFVIRIGDEIIGHRMFYGAAVVAAAGEWAIRNGAPVIEGRTA
jgi:hypothetical protein